MGQAVYKNMKYKCKRWWVTVLHVFVCAHLCVLPAYVYSEGMEKLGRWNKNIKMEKMHTLTAGRSWTLEMISICTHLHGNV